MTSATMHWSTERFIELSQTIQQSASLSDKNEATSYIPELQDSLDGVLDDLKGLLKTPPKSDQSRKKLESRKYTHCI